MNEQTRIVPALPSTSAELVALKKTMNKTTLNDHIDLIYVKLWDEPNFQRLFDAVYDEDAVEGSLAADNFLCAEMIRQYAKDTGNAYVVSKKLATITKALAVVARRYGQSRNERRATVHGEIQPAQSSADGNKE